MPCLTTFLTLAGFTFILSLKNRPNASGSFLKTERSELFAIALAESVNTPITNQKGDVRSQRKIQE